MDHDLLRVTAGYVRRHFPTPDRRRVALHPAVVVSLIGLVLIGLTLLVVLSLQGVSERTIAASLLVLCSGVFNVGGVLFTGRFFLKWQVDDAASFLRWERGFVIAATLMAVLGLALLEDMLHTAGDAYLARAGMVGYLFGAAVLVVAETTYLSRGEWVYPQIVVYVILAFLAQAAFGAALLQTRVVAGWAGWATVIWNVGWLLIMLIVRPRDFYFPVLHFVAPLFIGIGLVAGGWG
ncbi:MAG: hypothetical protein IT325_00910 [Anaerolineae bacterium]|nr:hypothetical protein [Anaerolineae bacterium]